MRDDGKDKQPDHSIESEPRRKPGSGRHEVDAPDPERADDETSEKTTVRQE